MPLKLPSTPNPSSCSRGNRDEETIDIITFPEGWGSGKLFEWYNEPTTCKKIVRLQLRKDNAGLHHRFIVLYMGGTVIRRFDRRPDPTLADNVRTVRGQPVPARDEHTRNVNNVSMRDIESSTLCEMELFLPDGVDFLSVISACFHIAHDTAAKDYTLFEHNCFFFSWTILMVVSRQCLPHRVPSHEIVVKRYLDTVPKLITELVNRTIIVGGEALLEALLIFRETTGPSVRTEMDTSWKLLLSIPPGVIKTLGRAVLRISSYMGPRQNIKKALEKNIHEKASEIWQNGLARNNQGEPLDAHLWLKNLHLKMIPVVNKELLKILWENVGEIFANGCTSESEQMVRDLVNSKRSSLCSRRAWEFRSVCISSLYGAISAVHSTLQTQPYDGNESHESVFNRLWSSASAGALAASKTAAEKSQYKVREKDRERWNKGWDAVWERWEAAWNAALGPVRKRIVDSINLCMKEYAEYGAELLLTEMRKDKAHMIKARVLDSASFLVSII